MTPKQIAHIEQLMANGKIENARALLDRLIAEKKDKDAIQMRAELEDLYPETRIVKGAKKGAKAANKVIFYVLAGITAFLVIAVIFGAIWMRLPK